MPPCICLLQKLNKPSNNPSDYRERINKFGLLVQMINVTEGQRLAFYVQFMSDLECLIANAQGRARQK